jgi:hypothetical protein
MTRAVNADLHAFVHQAILMHAGADVRLVEEIDGNLLDDACANAAENIVAGLPLQDDVVDALLVKELAEQESGRTGADDDDLGSHRFVLSSAAGFGTSAIRPL